MPSVACSVCGQIRRIRKLEFNLLHKDFPFICSKGCLVEKIKQFPAVIGPVRDYSIVQRFDPGPVWSSKFRMWFRSKYELKFAEFLNYAGFQFEYEPYFFTVGTSIIILDFYLRKYDLFLEVKGLFHMGSRSKLSRFVEQHPDINLLLVPAHMRREF